MDDKFLVISAALLPRFKLHWVAETQRGQLLDSLKAELARVVRRGGVAPKEAVVPTTDSDDFFGFTNNEITSSTSDRDGVHELNRFMDDEDADVTVMLKYPSLCELFLKYNAAVPSSAPVERLFSVAGNVFQRKRGRMTDANFEMQLLLRANKAYV